MKTYKFIFALIVLLGVLGCEKPLEHQFIYAFETPEEATPETINKVVKVLGDRFDYFGLKHNIETLDNNAIIIKAEANSLKDDVLNSLVTNVGKLEFYDTYNGNHIYNNLFTADTVNDGYSEIKTLLNSIIENGYPGQPVLFYLKPTDTLGVIKTLDRLKLKLPAAQQLVIFRYGKPGKDGTLPVYTILPNSDGKAALTGKVILEATQGYDYMERPVVNIKMDNEGALEWERLTRKANKNQSHIAIVFNDVVFSAPGVANGPITGGRSEISGDFTQHEAISLAAVLAAKEEIPQLTLVEYSKLEP